MNKQQIILIVSAILLTGGLYFLGSNVGPPKASPKGPMQPQGQQAALDVDAYLQNATSHLSASSQQYLTSLQQNVKRGDVKQQQIDAYKQQAAYWKDSASDAILYFHYLKKASSLENSEKSLTFAAQSILGYLSGVDSLPVKTWMANQSRELFEKALELNPHNDSSIVGLGSCYMYGASNGEANGPMTGILKVREVAARDSNNMFAQYMLGVGGQISGQYDKALSRFEKVVQVQPNNIDALFKLAETYEALGKKQEAIKWYQVILGKTKLPEMRTALQKRILELKG